MKEEIKEEQNAATPQVENKNETCCCGENNNHGACKHHHHHEKHHEQHEKVEQDSKALEAANTKIAELTAKLATTDKEKQELLDKVKLCQAELINYRRRKEEETNNMLKFANQDLILEILPIVDNFERAIKEDDNNLTDELSKFLAGFKIMYASLNDALKKYGVEEINRVGEIFNPSEEQALLTDSLPDHADEEVLEVLLKGYKLKGRVIRPASVKINQI